MARSTAAARHANAPEKRLLRLVRKGPRRLIARDGSRGRAPVVVAGLICVVAVIFGVLLEQVMLAQSAFKVERLREGMATAQKRHEELMLEAARLGSPERIEQYARSNLGMVEPASVEYIVANVRGGATETPLHWRIGQVESEAEAAAVSAGGAP